MGGREREGRGEREGCVWKVGKKLRVKKAIMKKKDWSIGLGVTDRIPIYCWRLFFVMMLLMLMAM